VSRARRLLPLIAALVLIAVTVTPVWADPPKQLPQTSIGPIVSEVEGLVQFIKKELDQIRALEESKGALEQKIDEIEHRIDALEQKIDELEKLERAISDLLPQVMAALGQGNGESGRFVNPDEAKAELRIVRNEICIVLPDWEGCQ